MRVLLVVIGFLSSYIVQAQLNNKEIYGMVLDGVTHQKIEKGTALLIQKKETKASIEVINGEFLFQNITPGRYLLQIKHSNYWPYLRELVINSAHDLSLEIYLKPSLVEMDELEVKAYSPFTSTNEMAPTSSREFSVDETKRYAGSRNDPSRMASNFAGVQGGNDSENGLVIRGNTPFGVKYLIEGIDIFPPHHYAIPGATGSAITLLNDRLIGDSQFYTGGFPAEYGNATTGIFDLSFRKGNTKKHQFSGQLGALGIELMAEGPLKPEQSSFVAAYRYSTLGLLNKLGLSLGTDAKSGYQDFNATADIKLSKKTNLKLIGLWGDSEIDIKVSERDEAEVQLYGENNKDQFFTTQQVTFGAITNTIFNQHWQMKQGIVFTQQKQRSTDEYVYQRFDEKKMLRSDSIVPILDYNFSQEKLNYLNQVLWIPTEKWVFKAGIRASLWHYDLKDSTRQILPNGSYTEDWFQGWNAHGPTFFGELYGQALYRITPKIKATLGVHTQYLWLNNTASGIEPRFGLAWQYSPQLNFGFAYSLHKQNQTLFTYLQQQQNLKGAYYLPNIDLEMNSNRHFVFHTNYQLNTNWNVKLEAYLQYLSNIPVELSSSAFSIVNEGSSGRRLDLNALVNEGKGRNKGIELSVRRLLDDHWYFLYNISLYDSKYQAKDGIWRNSMFNGRYGTNLLVGYEVPVQKKNQFSVGTKLTLAGGKRYGDVDLERSRISNAVVYQYNDNYNTKQFDDYFRWDIRFTYTLNKKKAAHTFALDVINVNNHKNILNYTFAPSSVDDVDPVKFNYQLGLLPLFYYRLDI